MLDQLGKQSLKMLAPSSRVPMGIHRLTLWSPIVMAERLKVVHRWPDYIIFFWSMPNFLPFIPHEMHIVCFCVWGGSVCIHGRIMWGMPLFEVSHTIHFHVKMPSAFKSLFLPVWLISFGRRPLALGRTRAFKETPPSLVLISANRLWVEKL